MTDTTPASASAPAPAPAPRPRHRRLQRRFAGVTLAAASVLGATLVSTPPTLQATNEFIVAIPAETSDGVKIEAMVWRPSGNGPHPIMVMPSSWGSNKLQYVGTAAEWARQGFLVINYTPRGWGFGPNTGLVDIAGTDTVNDVSTVIDWAVNNADGDDTRVGLAGVSYGAGISLMAASNDERVDAVVALSVWSDLEKSLYPNQTINKTATGLLIDVAKNPGPVLQDLIDSYEDQDISAGLAVAESRSPITYIDALNERGVAVMLGQGWGDSIFPPSGVMEFYEALTGPKKLAISPGDHGVPEFAAAGVVPTQRMHQAFEWINTHVAGKGVGVGVRNGNVNDYGGSMLADSVTFGFNVTKAGNYKMVASVKSPNGNDDSFWMGLNGQRNTKWLWDTGRYSDYRDATVRERGVSGNKIIRLDAGRNDITAWLREDGTFIKSMRLVQVDSAGRDISGGAQYKVEAHDATLAGRFTTDDIHRRPQIELTSADIDRVEVAASTADSFDDLVGGSMNFKLNEPRQRRHGVWPFYYYSPKYGDLTGSTSTGWTTSIRGGQASTADSILPGFNQLDLGGFVQGILADWVRLPQPLVPATLDRSRAVVWESGRYWDNPTIAGSPELKISVTPDRADTTFVVYLYEKRANEVAFLITHKAYTLRNAQPGQRQDLTIELEPTLWDIEKGSRLYMVIDTVDPRYFSTTTGGNVKFSSPSSSPASLTVPLLNKNFLR